MIEATTNDNNTLPNIEALSLQNNPPPTQTSESHGDNVTEHVSNVAATTTKGGEDEDDGYQPWIDDEVNEDNVEEDNNDIVIEPANEDEGSSNSPLLRPTFDQPDTSTIIQDENFDQTDILNVINREPSQSVAFIVSNDNRVSQQDTPPPLSLISHTPPGSPHPSVGGEPDIDSNTRVINNLVREHLCPPTCSPEEHQLGLQKHLHLVQNHRHVHPQCNSLADIQNITDPTVAGNEHIPHLLSRPDIHVAGRCQALKGGDLTPPANPVDMAAIREVVPFQLMFEGRKDDNARPQNVCLHLNEKSRLERPWSRSYDYDSVCGFAPSPAFCKRGLTCYPKPHRISNIKNHLHGVYFVQRMDELIIYRRINEMFHICWGVIHGLLDIKLYIVFPNLRSGGNIDGSDDSSGDDDNEPLFSNFLTDEEECLWNDGVMLPSIFKVLPSKLLMELAGSWHAATANSLAKSGEQSRTGKLVDGRQQLLRQYIPPEYLDAIWKNCLQLIEESEAFSGFRGCRLFFNGKDFKQHTAQETCTAREETWQQLWGSTIDESILNDDEWWIDDGWQFNPPDHSLPGDVVDPETHEAETYLLKECCLRDWYKKRTQYCAKSHLRMDIYPHATLRDTCTATFTPSTKSQEFLAGRVYTQAYSKTKVNFTSATISAFADPALETLALDPDYIKDTQRLGGGVSVNLDTQRKNYIRGKNRVHQNLLNAARMSYAIRYEERLTARLSKAVTRRLIEIEQRNQSPNQEARAEQETTSMDARNVPFYIVPSQTFFGFIRGQVNKYCLGLEYTLWGCDPKYTKWAQTQAAIIFLRALRYSYGSGLIQAEPLLWKDSWSRKGKFRPKGWDPAQLESQHEGMGMACNVRRSGFGWLAAKFNPGTWELKPNHTAHILLENNRLVEHYKRRQNAVRDAKDIYTQLDQIGTWLGLYRDHPMRLRVVLEYISGLCLTQFRADVFNQLHKDGAIRGDDVAAAITGQLPLCHQTLRLLLTDGEPWLVGGNKTALKDPGQLISYLFDEGDFYIGGKKRERLHWNDMTYRILFHKMFTVLTEHLGERLAKQWRRKFKSAMLILNHILPYPDYNSFFSRTKARAGRGQDTDIKTRRCWMGLWLYPNGALEDLSYGAEKVQSIQAYGARYQAMLTGRKEVIILGGQTLDDSKIELSLPIETIYELELIQKSFSELDNYIQSKV